MGTFVIPHCIHALQYYHLCVTRQWVSTKKRISMQNERSFFSIEIILLSFVQRKNENTRKENEKSKLGRKMKHLHIVWRCNEKKKINETTTTSTVKWIYKMSSKKCENCKMLTGLRSELALCVCVCVSAQLFNVSLIPETFFFFFFFPVSLLPTPNANQCKRNNKNECLESLELFPM